MRAYRCGRPRTHFPNIRRNDRRAGPDVSGIVIEVSWVRADTSTEAREAGLTSDHRRHLMRTFIAAIAVLGVLTAGLGVFLSAGWVILVGASAVVVAVVMGALAAPATRRQR